jgi:hypothetical protein
MVSLNGCQITIKDSRDLLKGNRRGRGSLPRKPMHGTPAGRSRTRGGAACVAEARRHRGGNARGLHSAPTHLRSALSPDRRRRRASPRRQYALKRTCFSPLVRAPGFQLNASAFCSRLLKKLHAAIGLSYSLFLPFLPASIADPSLRSSFARRMMTRLPFHTASSDGLWC